MAVARVLNSLTATPSPSPGARLVALRASRSSRPLDEPMDVLVALAVALVLELTVPVELVLLETVFPSCPGGAKNKKAAPTSRAATTASAAVVCQVFTLRRRLAH